MKTIRDLFKDMPLDGLTKGALRTVLLSFIPNSMDKTVELRINKEAGWFSIWYDGALIVQGTFEEAMAYVNGPEVDQGIPEGTVGAPAGDPGVPGEANLLPDGCPGEEPGADHGTPGAPSGGV